MKTDSHLIIINRAALAESGGWIHIVPAGELRNHAAGLVQVLDEKAFDSILANIEADRQRLGDRWPGVYAGEEHFIYNDAKSSAAFAWFKDFEKRADGIWARDDGLTDLGREAVQNRRFKFTSFVADRRDTEPLDGNKVRILKIDTVGFTNQANGKELLTPICNREYIFNYDPNQERDEWGRWTDENGYEAVATGNKIEISSGGKKQTSSVHENSQFTPIPKVFLDHIKKAGRKEEDYFSIDHGTPMRSGVKPLAEKAISGLKQKRLESESTLRKNVPGIDELRSARNAEESSSYAFKKAMERGDGRLPSKYSGPSPSEIATKYPAAASYLHAESFTQSSHPAKYSAGKKAVERISKGEDHKKVIAEMEEEWAKEAMESTLRNRENFAGEFAPAVNQNPQPKGKSMQNIAKKLGLAAEASEEAVLEAIAKLQERATALESENKEMVANRVEADLVKYADRFTPEAKDTVKAALLRNRAETVALLESVRVTAPAPAKAPLVLNRGDAKTPAANAAAAPEAAMAEKIVNRANVLVAGGMKFEKAWNQARTELAEPDRK